MKPDPAKADAIETTMDVLRDLELWVDPYWTSKLRYRLFKRYALKRLPQIAKLVRTGLYEGTWV